LNQRGKHYYKWQQARRVFVKENPDAVCSYCGGPAGDVDHIKKRSTHPHLRYDQANLQWLCRKHHIEKDSGSSKVYWD
jgi:5-methylcytosine-specific restriction endonuclease McrA